MGFYITTRAYNRLRDELESLRKLNLKSQSYRETLLRLMDMIEKIGLTPKEIMERLPKAQPPEAKEDD